MDPNRKNHLHNFIVFTELSKSSSTKPPASSKDITVPVKNTGAILAASLLVLVILLLALILGTALGNGVFLGSALIIGCFFGAFLLRKALKKSS